MSGIKARGWRRRSKTAFKVVNADTAASALTTLKDAMCVVAEVDGVLHKLSNGEWSKMELGKR